MGKYVFYMFRKERVRSVEERERELFHLRINILEALSNFLSAGLEKWWRVWWCDLKTMHCPTTILISGCLNLHEIRFFWNLKMMITVGTKTNLKNDFYFNFCCVCILWIQFFDQHFGKLMALEISIFWFSLYRMIVRNMKFNFRFRQCFTGYAHKRFQRILSMFLTRSGDVDAMNNSCLKNG